jgi:hypothetical protein
MSKQTLFIAAAVLLLLVSMALVGERVITIEDMRVAPNPVGVGARVVISCRVAHTKGRDLIDRVSATLQGEERGAGYSQLYDDGTHGDRVAGDGVYSLEIDAFGPPGEQRLVFQALDSRRIEVESEPIILQVK